MLRVYMQPRSGKEMAKKQKAEQRRPAEKKPEEKETPIIVLRLPKQPDKPPPGRENEVMPKVAEPAATKETVRWAAALKRSEIRTTDGHTHCLTATHRRSCPQFDEARKNCGQSHATYGP